jgi:uncharacterized membrane protein
MNTRKEFHVMNYRAWLLRAGLVLSVFALSSSSVFTSSFTSIDVPGKAFTVALGINDPGQIVGYYRAGGVSDASHGFLLEQGTFTTIDVPGAFFTEPFGINGRGQIVGGYGPSVGESHGFLLGQGSFTTIDVPGASATLATGINNRGQIVGIYSGFHLRVQGK